MQAKRCWTLSACYLALTVAASGCEPPPEPAATPPAVAAPQPTPIACGPAAPDASAPPVEVGAGQPGNVAVGNNRFEIPEGALPAARTFTMAVAAGGPLRVTLQAGEPVRFSEPARLHISYGRCAEQVGENPGRLTIYRRVPPGNTFEPLPTFHSAADSTLWTILDRSNSQYLIAE